MTTLAGTDVDTAGEAIKLLSGNRTAQMQFALFSRDVDSAEIAYSHIDAIRQSPDSVQLKAIMYHASSFVCAVRRVGRMLESMVGSKNHYKSNAAEAIKLEWRKKRAFFCEFVEPRDAIEHIDDKLKSTTRLRFFNMWNDVFEVMDGKKVTINHPSLQKVLECRNRIAAAIVEDYGGK